MNNQEILNRILNSDRVFGKLCQEAENSYENENYFAAIACLFVASEQIIKYSLDKNSGNYFQSLTEAKKKEIIGEVEFTILDDMRGYRNAMFHENNYSSGFESNGKYFPFDEDETKKVIYETFSQDIFGIIEKII